MKTACWFSFLLLGACAHTRAPSGPPRSLTKGNFGDVPAGTEQPVWFVYTSMEFARHRVGAGPVDDCLQQAKADPQIGVCWFLLDACTTLEVDLTNGLSRLDVYAIGDRVPLSRADGVPNPVCGVVETAPQVGRSVLSEGKPRATK